MCQALTWCWAYKNKHDTVPAAKELRARTVLAFSTQEISTQPRKYCENSSSCRLGPLQAWEEKVMCEQIKSSRHSSSLTVLSGTCSEG